MGVDMPAETVQLSKGYILKGKTERVYTKIVRREDGGTEHHCALCNVPLNWFNFENIWENGLIVARVHSYECNESAQ